MMSLLARFLGGSLAVLGVGAMALPFAEPTAGVCLLLAWLICVVPSVAVLAGAVLARDPQSRTMLLYGGTPFRMFFALLAGWAVVATIPQIAGSDGLLFWRWLIPIYLALLAWEVWLVARHTPH